MQFEYLTLTELPDGGLNALGATGWELVVARLGANQAMPFEGAYIFKRAVLDNRVLRPPS